MAERIFRIGTRTSPLALWQAKHVEEQVHQLHYSTSIVGVKTLGDLDRNKPIPLLGNNGVFTKALDDSLLNEACDLAVHSLKDYPTDIHPDLLLGAVLRRDYYYDVFVPSSRFNMEEIQHPMIIACGSPRRQAQWLARYPNHECVNLRGNMDTRLTRLQEYHGGILSEAGLNRLGILPTSAFPLEWMVPAPAQGVMAIVCRKDDKQAAELLKRINHVPTHYAVHLERSFMSAIEAGCAAPLGAHAVIIDGKPCFKGILLSLDGKKKVVLEKEVDPKQKADDLGIAWGQEILALGGKAIMEQIRASAP